MRSGIIIISAVLLFQYCDQTPTTLDPEPYVSNAGANIFVLEITRFEFDVLTNEFFFSVLATSPQADLALTAEILLADVPVKAFELNDDGRAMDILANDNSFEMSWQLPDLLLADIENIWTLRTTAHSDGETISKSQSVEPELFTPPVIHSVLHRDTLQLSSSGLVLDTLSLLVSHPTGLDEIRDVNMLSLKPDGNYANNGQPIPLYDDGGKEIFFSFEGIDFTSGDRTANDGTYSLILALTPSTLSGTYYWTFNSRTWDGDAAVPLMDSLTVLPATSVSSVSKELISLKGTIQ